MAGHNDMTPFDEEAGLGLSPQARRYVRFWLGAVFIAEATMLIRHHDLFVIYMIIAGLFAAGWLLRVTNLYPGEAEPLILDLSAVFIAVVMAVIARALGASAWRFLLIFGSSLIILPHLAYIYLEK